MSGRKSALLGYACGLGGQIPGSEKGPDALRSLKIQERIEELGYRVFDRGDAGKEKPSKVSAADGEKSLENLEAVYSSCKELTLMLEDCLKKDLFPLVLGGDHSLSIASIAAVSNHYHKRGEKIGLIWIDTHPDLNTPESSPSKCIHGISTAVLLGRVPGILSSLQQRTPAVDPENLVYLGLRDVDPGEKDYLAKNKLNAYTMKEIDIIGMAEATKLAIAHACKDTAGFVVSFDLDVCDPHLVPGTGTPKRGGLTFREAHLALELVHDSGKLLGFEMVELNPTLDQDFKTAELAVSLCESVLGKSII